jgi:ferredoxin
MAKIEAMDLTERWVFWQTEFSRCFKCYACRQACPLCYCDQCTVEMNQPQWIPVASTGQGNLEWHLMRAMHLAGRCISCGQCGAACPMDIPLHLLTFKVSQDIREVFGTVPGKNLKESCAMATFQPGDKENFIG